MTNVMTLGEVATYINGRAFKPSEWEETGLPIIRIQNLTESNKKYNYSSKTFDEKFRIKNDDLLFAWSASLGAFIWKGGDAWLNQHIFKVEPKPFIQKRYLYYFLLYVIAALYAKTHGSGMVHITKRPFMSTPIQVPSRPEQKRIVEKIDELFSGLDAAESELRVAKEKLEKYRTIIIDSIFSKCTTRKLNTLCDVITDGDHQPPPKSESGVPFIMISNIEGNVINWENTAFVDLKYYQGIGEKRTPKKGDILYTVTGSFGIPVSVDFERKFCFQRHIALLRPIKSVQHKFLFYALQTSGVFTQAVEQSTGTAQKTVGLGVLRNFNVPFTESQKDQESIINEIDFFLNGHRKIEQTIERALRQCCNLRHSVLTQAFEGDLA